MATSRVCRTASGVEYCEVGIGEIMPKGFLPFRVKFTGAAADNFVRPAAEQIKTFGCRCIGDLVVLIREVNALTPQTGIRIGFIWRNMLDTKEEEVG